MRRTVAATAAFVLSAGLVATAPAYAGGSKGEQKPTKGVDTASLTKGVTVNGILQHARQLQVIADRNGGNRASGLPGYDASADYVAAKLEAAGYEVTRQTFTFPFFRETGETVLERVSPDPGPLETGIFDYSGGGDVTGVVVPTNDLVVPATPEPSSTSGCQPSDFAAAPAGPAVALVQRGGCDFAVKVANAEAAGYDAVIIFNEGNPGRTDLTVGTLGAPAGVPVVGLSYADALAILEDDAAGDVTVRVKTEVEVDLERKTSNVIADLPGKVKNPDEVVVVGAHLDSVAEGPGINDNGSGTAATLEIAEQLKATGLSRKLQRPVRFAFWGAEEKGLLGAYEYVESLTDTERSKIYANLNFDMIGSPNYVRFVYDGDGSSEGVAGPAGSGEIERVFTDYFATRKLATAPTAFDGRSDYGPFIEVGIPAGGLFSGAEGIKTPEEAAVFGGTAGAPYDACYHAACDTIANLSTKALDQLGDAAAHATGVLTLSKAGLYGDGARKKNAKPSGKAGKRVQQLR